MTTLAHPSRIVSLLRAGLEEGEKTGCVLYYFDRMFAGFEQYVMGGTNR